MSIESKTIAQNFDAIVSECKSLMLAKNHDYGDSWRVMRLPSITDQILIKANRIRRLEELRETGQSPKVSEGIEVEYKDILNYCVFAITKLREEIDELQDG